MNIFSSFTFGRLIKTFVPGFFWLISLALVVDGYLRPETNLPSLIDKHSDALIFSITVILCVILGLISNTLVFAGLNDHFVRTPVRLNARNQTFIAAKDRIETRIKQHFCELLTKQGAFDGENGPALRRETERCLDPEYTIIQKDDFSKIVYVQEQYWYYMEIHINLAFSIALCFTCHVVRAMMAGIDVVNEETFLGLALTLVLFIGLVKMARTNYLRHLKKIFSIYCVFLSETISRNDKENTVPSAG